MRSVIWGEHSVAEVSHFAYGWVNPVLSYAMSVVGCLLGTTLTAKAAAHTSRQRGRLLLCASLAFGAIGVWQAHVIALLGFTVPRTAVRFDQPLLAVNLAIAVAAAGGGLSVLRLRRLRVWRLPLAHMFIAAGLAGAHYLGMVAVRTAGSVHHEPARLLGSIALDLAAAGAVVWFVEAANQRTAIAAGPLLGAVVCLTHYVGMSAVRVHLGGDHVAIVGAGPLLLFGPVVLVGAATAATLWFFTVGHAPEEEPPTVSAKGHTPQRGRTGELAARIVDAVEHPFARSGHVELARSGHVGRTSPPRRLGTPMPARPSARISAFTPGVSPDVAPRLSPHVVTSRVSPDFAPRVGNGRNRGTPLRIGRIRWQIPAI